MPQSRINNHKMQQHEDFKIRKVKQVNTFRDSASKIPIIDPNYSNEFGDFGALISSKNKQTNVALATIQDFEKKKAKM